MVLFALLCLVTMATAAPAPAVPTPADLVHLPSEYLATICKDNCAENSLSGTCEKCVQGFQAPLCCECADGFTKRGGACVPVDYKAVVSIPARSDSASAQPADLESPPAVQGYNRPTRSNPALPEAQDSAPSHAQDPAVPTPADIAPSLSHLVCQENCVDHERHLDGTCDRCHKGFLAPYCCECPEGLTKSENQCRPARSISSGPIQPESIVSSDPTPTPTRADSVTVESSDQPICRANCGEDSLELDGTCSSCHNGFQPPYCCECQEGLRKVRPNFCY